MEITVKEALDLGQALKELENVNGLSIETMIKLCKLQFAIEPDCKAYLKAKSKTLEEKKIAIIPQNITIEHSYVSLESGLRILVNTSDLLNLYPQFEEQEAKVIAIEGISFTKKEFEVEVKEKKMQSVLSVSILKHLYKFIDDAK